MDCIVSRAQGILRLTLGTGDQQVLGYRPGLDATTATKRWRF
jgi:hypothetical protein